jgi:hypothetical protein
VGVGQEVQEGLVVERGVQPEPQVGLIVERVAEPALQAAVPTPLNPLVDKAVRAEILRPNLPAARARIASIFQGPEWGRGAQVRADSGNVAGCRKPHGRHRGCLLTIGAPDRLDAVARPKVFVPPPPAAGHP